MIMQLHPLHNNLFLSSMSSQREDYCAIIPQNADISRMSDYV